jgi:hypothetical protein
MQRESKLAFRDQFAVRPVGTSRKVVRVFSNVPYPVKSSRLVAEIPVLREDWLFLKNARTNRIDTKEMRLQGGCISLGPILSVLLLPSCDWLQGIRTGSMTG